MAFSALASGVTTQTGTDANLSGMSALTATGYTYLESGGLRNVFMNQANARLFVNGTLTIPMDTDALTIGNAASANPINIGSGGTLRLQYAPNGAPQPGFGIKSSHNNGVFWGNGVIAVGGGGLLDLDGSGVYSVGASINFGGGASFRARNAILRGGQVGGITSMFRNNGGTTTYDIIGLTMVDYTFVCDGTPVFTNLSGLTMRCTVGGTNNVAFIPQGTMTLIGPQFLGNYQTHIGTSLGSGAGQRKVVYGYETGLAPLIGKVPDYGTAVNWVEGRKIINLTVRDTALNVVQNVSTSFVDVNNSRRYNGTSISATDYTADITYTGTSSAAGLISLDVLLWEVAGAMSAANTIGGVTPAGNVNSNMVVDYRWTGNGPNYQIMIPLKGYTVLPGFVTVDANGLAQTVTPTAFLSPDANVTLTPAQAAALTAVSTLDNLYDAAKNWSTQSVNFAYPSRTTQPANGNGAVLDLGSLNLVVDSAAATAFAVNTSTNTITIKSAVLAEGVKFKSIKTTGTITTAGSGLITAPFTDANQVGFITAIGTQGNSVELRRVSNNAVLRSRTGDGLIAVAPADVGVQVYLARVVGSVLVASSVNAPKTLAAGDNGVVSLYAGDQVQVANINNLVTLAQIEASSVLAKRAELVTINNGIKLASLMIPHASNL
jgi:hypothetical protein